MAGAPGMIEQRLWLPVLAAEQLAAGEARPIQLLDHSLVLWRDHQARAAIATDRCPHRGTPLSMGRVCKDRLVCAYHGWAFDTDGRCREIPAMPELSPGDRHALRRHELREAHGLLWVRLGAGHDAPLLAEPPPFDGPTGLDGRQVLCGPFEVATSAPRVIENFLDMAHFVFVHPGTLGDPQRAQISDYRVEAGGALAGVRATDCLAWQPRSNLLSQAGAWVRYRYWIASPYAAWLAKCPEGWDDYHESIGLFASPVRADLTRVWFLIATSATTSSDEQIRAFQAAIFEQDRAILEAQRPVSLPLDPSQEMSCAADRLSLAYRAYLRELGLSVGVV